MKVCVIGGAGYIGSHAVYELKRANHEVVVIDNLSTGHRHFVPTDVSFYEGDITDKVFMHDTFALENSKKPIDVVMHFAGKIIVPESMKKPLEYFYNNVEGVRVMLETMTQFNIKNIVFSSTAAVYGNPTNGICHEEDILSPINVYGETKLMDEKMIKWTSEIYGMNYCIFRYLICLSYMFVCQLFGSYVLQFFQFSVVLFTGGKKGYRGCPFIGRKGCFLRYNIL